MSGINSQPLDSLNYNSPSQSLIQDVITVSCLFVIVSPLDSLNYNSPSQSLIQDVITVYCLFVYFADLKLFRIFQIKNLLIASDLRITTN